MTIGPVRRLHGDLCLARSILRRDPGGGDAVAGPVAHGWSLRRAILHIDRGNWNVPALPSTKTIDGNGGAHRACRPGRPTQLRFGGVVIYGIRL